MGKHKGVTAAEPPLGYTRHVRRLRRQCVLGMALAALVLTDLYLPGAGAWAWIDWAQSSVGGALIFDVVLRPIIPAEITVRFGPNDRTGT